MVKPVRCCVCNRKIKKVFVEALKCKCLANVCRYHRFPDQHSCTYDFQNENKSRLRKELPRVECDKLVKI